MALSRLPMPTLLAAGSVCRHQLPSLQETQHAQQAPTAWTHGPSVLCNVWPSSLIGVVVALRTIHYQIDLDNQYALWPAEKLEYSGVGLDVG